MPTSARRRLIPILAQRRLTPSIQRRDVNLASQQPTTHGISSFAGGPTMHADFRWSSQTWTSTFLLKGIAVTITLFVLGGATCTLVVLKQTASNRAPNTWKSAMHLSPGAQRHLTNSFADSRTGAATLTPRTVDAVTLPTKDNVPRTTIRSSAVKDVSVDTTSPNFGVSRHLNNVEESPFVPAQSRRKVNAITPPRTVMATPSRPPPRMDEATRGIPPRTTVATGTGAGVAISTDAVVGVHKVPKLPEHHPIALQSQRQGGDGRGLNKAFDGVVAISGGQVQGDDRGNLRSGEPKIRFRVAKESESSPPTSMPTISPTSSAPTPNPTPMPTTSAPTTEPIKTEFPECVEEWMTAGDCKELIDSYLADHIEQGEPWIRTVVVHRRSARDFYYNKVVIPVDDRGFVTGVNDDGKIFYPFKWNGSGPEGEREIGPWTCVGMKGWECCSMLRPTVPDWDVNGNSLGCYIEYPLGSPKNPVKNDRILIYAAHNNHVYEPPRIG